MIKSQGYDGAASSASFMKVKYAVLHLLGEETAGEWLV